MGEVPPPSRLDGHGWEVEEVYRRPGERHLKSVAIHGISLAKLVRRGHGSGAGLSGKRGQAPL